MSKGKERIRESQLRYKHHLGQHFLYDETLLKELVRLSGVGPEDDVLEVGPGCGSLTAQLAQAAHQVLALELDERLLPLLGAFLQPYANVRLVQGDVMTADLPALTASLRAPFCVVANIPYYITTPLVRLLLSGALPLKRLALMVQREVAAKMLAQPGEADYGPLALLCQYRCKPYLALDVSAACFTPPPKVDSAFMVLPVREAPPVDAGDERLLFRVIAAAFAMRRKTLANNLCALFRWERAQTAALLADCGVDPRARGESLSLADFAQVSRRSLERGLPV